MEQSISVFDGPIHDDQYLTRRCAFCCCCCDLYNLSIICANQHQNGWL